MPPRRGTSPASNSDPAEVRFIVGLGEVNRTLGEITASLAHLTKAVDSTRAKVDDLVAWKNWILGGAAMLGVVAALSAFGIRYVSENFSMTQKSGQPPSAPAIQQVPLVPPASPSGISKNGR